MLTDTKGKLTEYQILEHYFSSLATVSVEKDSIYQGNNFTLLSHILGIDLIGLVASLNRNTLVLFKVCMLPILF